ncbi:MAG TPA: lysylphosphatidylglycerol synthase transmembrane domain-containing protein [Acidobacteriota bacterium]|nr:lysylphosphatidylglycerol synthase transmembrane domain-containing protein [Acidobacteriota bacterium]
MKKKKVVSFMLSALVSMGLLLFLFSKIDFSNLVQTFQNIFVPALIGFMILSLMGSGLRAWRYKWLLLPQKISWKNIFLVTFIRNLFVDFFPARIGSLSYIYILNRKLKYSFEASSSTFVIAFLFDFLTLSPILIMAVFFVGLGTTILSGPLMIFLSILFFLAFYVILWKTIPLSNLLLKIYISLLKITKLRKKKWADLSIKKVESSIKSLNQIKNRNIYWPIFLLSLFIRLAKYSSLYLLLFSLLQSHGIPLNIMNFFKTVLGITGAEMSSALPIKGIGGFGTWESAWVLTSKLMNFDTSLAIISGIGIHLISNLFEYLLGIISLLVLYSPLYKAKKNK